METVQTTTNNLSGGLQNAWATTLAFIPNLIAFLLVLVVGYFVAVALGKVVDKVLQKVGFDKAVERGGIKQALAASGYHPSAILGKIAFYTAFLFVLQLAFGVFGQNPISDLLTRVIAFLPNVFVAIVIVVLSASIAAAVKDVVKGTLGGLSYGAMLANVAGGAIVLVGAFAALNQLAIAPEIVNGLFYAILAIVVGVSVVAIGGAGIVPMRARWEAALGAIEREAPKAIEHVQSRASGVPVTPSAKTTVL
ncbi:hypothetical protein EON79_22725 [bacterium]|nr:MAG: hypothetical protein EON79_22725 [bacterium]